MISRQLVSAVYLLSKRKLKRWILKNLNAIEESLMYFFLMIHFNYFYLLLRCTEIDFYLETKQKFTLYKKNV